MDNESLITHNGIVNKGSKGTVETTEKHILEYGKV